ncbi:hypothetical protein B0H17DRAFT_1128229 [Mycena rosella]|uniref:Uncharacterized protein n=1 Tax=Mycena rosella TaxID=1033263 RepID=A0AAD7GMB4_MYCRO|nr:hypothetical protein B0H17DRAFT_1128229 [Mycena rosella]
MHFSTSVLFASSVTLSLVSPAPQTTPSIDSLVSQTSTVMTHLTNLCTLGVQIAVNSSSVPEASAAIHHINHIVAILIASQSGGLLSGSLGGSNSRLLGILSRDGSILSGLLSGDLLGDLLCGSTSSRILSSILRGNLLGGLLNGLLRGLLSKDGGLLGELLGSSGSAGLLSSITGLLNLFPGLGSSCGIDLVGELLGVVQGLVGSLTSLLPDT